MVEAPLAVGGAGEAVLGAAPVAGEEIGTFAALAHQGSGLGAPELAPARRLRQTGQTIAGQTAEAIFGIDVVVAGEDLAVVLERQRRAALLGEDAQRGGQAQPLPS